MKKILQFLIIINLFIPGLLSANEEPQEYSAALNLFQNEKYVKSIKGFEKVIKKYPDTEWSFKAHIYTARAYLKTGRKEKAVELLKERLENAAAAEQKMQALEELAETASENALDLLKSVLKKSRIKELRKKAADEIANMLNNPKEDVSKLTGFLFGVLKNETETEVAKSVSSAIYKTGKVKIQELKRIYKNADKAYKKKLLYLISKYDDEDLVMMLQDENSRSGNSIRKYISWALAKMDPYRFAQSFSGKIKKENEEYFLYGKNFRKKLMDPSAKQDAEELEEFNGQKVIVYGIDAEDGIIYTDIFIK